MSTRLKDTTFELSAEHLLVLTYEDFNVFSQAEMIRMSSDPTSPPPGPTKLIGFWTFIPLFLFFDTFNQCFQDASAQVTEGLVLKL